MNIVKYRSFAVFSLLFLSQFSYAQSGDASSYMLWALLALGAVMAIFAILSLADNLIQIEGQKSGIDTKKTNLGIFPTIGELFSKKAPSFASDDSFVALDKGFDLKLAGNPSGSVVESSTVNRFAIKPKDFLGMSPIPKVVVAEGDEVKAGDALFFDKKRPEIMYVSPVSGEVVEVKRGEKRSIAEVIILADKEQGYKSFDVPNLESTDRAGLKTFMAESGAWSYINQRPFDMVASLETEPKNIFISTFDSAPLAIDTNVIVEGNEAAFQKGLDVLGKLTDGNVYLGLDGRGSKPSAAFANATGVVKTYFSGKHPVGNVGVQIHHTAPISGQDVVWTLDINGVITIGKLFAEGKYDATRLVSIGGAMVTNPRIVKTVQGASVGDLLGEGLNTEEGTPRIIDGDVLTGKEASADGFLGFKTNKLSVIKEGDNYEAFGWLLPIKPRPSISGTFPNFLFPKHEFEGETNTHGEKRAFVVSGQYESVLPMDIYPQHLMKAIMAGDFEKMEGLGINELSEEDLALCEFVCTSKMPLQSILRDGLEMMREQA